MGPGEAIVFTVGALVALGTLLAAIQTVVVPRAERSLLIRFVYVGMGMLFSVLARRRKTYEAKDALLARYAPTTLMFLPVVWATGVIYGFSLMFWALDVRPYREALTLSGWSLTTLGYRVTTDFFTLTLAGLEALIGLGIVALLISFLPVMHSAFSAREAAVARLEIRAGTPPAPTAPVTVRRHEFYETYETLKNAGVPVVEDRDQAWRDYAGWRVNYDNCLVGLASITSAPPGKWSTDRPSPYHRLPLFYRPLRRPLPPLLREIRRRGFGSGRRQ